MLARRTCEPAATSDCGDCAFTVACVPTGMKTGVSTSPWSVRKVAARACEPLACASMRKSSREGAMHPEA